MESILRPRITLREPAKITCPQRLLEGAQFGFGDCTSEASTATPSPALTPRSESPGGSYTISAIRSYSFQAQPLKQIPRASFSALGIEPCRSVCASSFPTFVNKHVHAPYDAVATPAQQTEATGCAYEAAAIGLRVFQGQASKQIPRRSFSALSIEPCQRLFHARGSSIVVEHVRDPCEVVATPNPELVKPSESSKRCNASTLLGPRILRDQATKRIPRRSFNALGLEPCQRTFRTSGTGSIDEQEEAPQDALWIKKSRTFDALCLEFNPSRMSSLNADLTYSRRTLREQAKRTLGTTNSRATVNW